MVNIPGGWGARLYVRKQRPIITIMLHCIYAIDISPCVTYTYAIYCRIRDKGALRGSVGAGCVMCRLLLPAAVCVRDSVRVDAGQGCAVTQQSLCV